MTRFIFTGIWLCCLLQTNAQSRERITLNSGWDFVLNDQPEPSFIQQPAWQKINLPHTWNAKDIIDDNIGYHQGIGWYRKLITLNAKDTGMHLELFFEGACNKTTVYVNRQLAGEHEGGFTGFRINLDNLLPVNRPNEILVKVDNSKTLQDIIPPFSGDFNLMGGIYRDVWLLRTNKAHFTGRFGSQGIFFETPAVSTTRAHYKLKCFFNSSREANPSVEYTLSFRQQVIQTGNAVLKNNRGDSIVFNAILNNPSLWSPEAPDLYELKVSLKNSSGQLLDEVVQHVGFKSVTISASNEFLLNGRPYKLKGASRHQDYHEMGSALPDALHVQDLQLMKEMGCNFIRIAHYPQDPAVYEACDRLGLLAWSEIPVVDHVVDNPVFFSNSKKMMQEMIWQNFNHPSVAIWGYHNEVRNISAPTIDHAKMLDSIAKTIDPQRLTAMAFESNVDAAYFRNPLLREILNIADINGYNVYQGWYRGKYQNIGDFLDSLYAFNPKKPIMLSEYGAGSNINIHSNQPTIFDFTEEYQCAFHEAYLDAGDSKPWMIGYAIWNFIDFQRDGREDVSPNINNKGMVTTDRQKKDVFYFYKTRWSNGPFIYISGKEWKNRIEFFPSIALNQQTKQNITVYSNQASLQCYCNGNIVNPVSSSKGKFVFPVLFTSGKNSLFCRTADGRLSDVLTVHYEFLDSVNLSKNNSWSQLNFNTGQTRTFFRDTRSGESWMPDKRYTKGSWGFVGGDVWNSWPSPSWHGIREGVHKPIANSSNEPIYQTFVQNLSAWKADLPDGKYRIKISLCEPFSGQQRNNTDRVLNISANGGEWLESINLEKEAGILTAMDFEKEIIITGGRGLTIGFKGITGQTILNGVSITKY